jgi:hypothetical protein
VRVHEVTVELEHLKPDRAMSLPREGSLAGQKLRPCQKAGWHREITREVWKW